MFKRKYSKLLVILSIVLVVFVGCKVYTYFSNTIKDVKFSRVIDGDSFYLIIKGEEVECRLIGIDAPEVDKNEDYSKEAKYYVQGILTNANNICVEYDDKAGRYDNYGRVLVYVFVDDKLLQNEILRNGYAKVAYVYDDYKYLNDMKKQEVYARSNNLNIWKSK